jgi:hypothetical protein
MCFSVGVPAKFILWGDSSMKRFGKVDIPAEAFTVMLKRD